MPTRPLLRLPSPNVVAAPPGHAGPTPIRLPSKGRQGEKFGPTLDRLHSVLSREGAAAIELRDDPSSLAPERVVVFEIAGTVEDFLNALVRVDGFELMAEYETAFAPDDDFAVKDKRKATKGQDRSDKRVPGRLYLAMPDVQALKELVRLWEIWRAGGNLGKGRAPFAHLFGQLHALRPWGPQDRIPAETVAFWREESERFPDRPVRTEVELWYRGNPSRREEASQTVRTLVGESGGQVVHEAVIPEIAYHGMLIDIPSGEVQNLLSQQPVKLALADGVMFLRPQSLMLDPQDVEAAEDESVAERTGQPAAAQPVAALLDGVPVPAHALLVNRLTLDDPDDLQSRTLVSGRVHGTAMASLIVHGDCNEPNQPLSRPLYVRPVMILGEDGQERTESDRLVIDTIYRAVVRMKGSEGQEATAPTVFLINLSMGDTRRPFAGLVSPLARLLDFLSYRYNVLFLVSGGNVTDALVIPDYEQWTAFEAADPKDRERAVVAAINAAKQERTMLSPAESLNALTIGGQHRDNVSARLGAQFAVDPFENERLPNVSSGLGLGYRRMVKPELYFPAGREHLRFQSAGDGLVVKVCPTRRLYGLNAAAPDPTGQGKLDYMALSGGTSSATALATRAGHKIFDAMMDSEAGSLLADTAPDFYAVVVKALLVHGARWDATDDILLKSIFGPADLHRFIERGENCSRFIGFGVADVGVAMECSANRATLVGAGTIAAEAAHGYRIPLPACLERVTDPRSLTVTVAWFSPIKSGHQRYRSLRLEADALYPPPVALGVERKGAPQPADATVKRGSVFHEQYFGTAAVPFVDDGHLVLRVWCKEDAGSSGGELVRYGIAVTIESENALPIYDQIQQRLRVRPQA